MLVGAAGSMLALISAPPLRAEQAVFVCTNPASGASWRVQVDYARSLVDSFPATITPHHITWRDTSGGARFDLDLVSGELTVTTASSTGGYFLHDRCRSER